MPRPSLIGIVLAAAIGIGLSTTAQAGSFPAPAEDQPLAPAPGTEKAVFSGGCFWGVQGVFEHVKGVSKVLSGYAGGEADTAHYEMVSTGATGHAESVQVEYDPSKVSYGTLLKVFFSVAHDPTELNYQGPDTGPQYRSAIFYANPAQQHLAEAYIAQLDGAHQFSDKIVTQVTPLSAFYPAEAYHQDFLVHHPMNMYIVINDKPKIAHLQKDWPDLYVEYKPANAS